MVFGKGGKLVVRENWTFGNKSIEIVNSYRYIGIDLTSKL